MSTDSFIVKDCRIFTGTEIVEDGYVHVEDGKIKSVGTALPGSAERQGEIEIVSKPGHTLLPGLIDAHIHADKGNPLALTQSLKFGVTTVMDMHNEPENVAKLKKLARENRATHADFKSACLAATIENGWPVPVVTAHDKSERTAREIATWPKLKEASEAEAYVRKSVADGAEYIKLMHESGSAMGHDFAFPSTELQRAVVEAAHGAGLKAVAHATSLSDTIGILGAGVDGLTHTIIDAAPTRELVRAYERNGAWCNPTLGAMGSLTSEGREAQERIAEDARVKALCEEGSRQGMCRCMGMAREGASVEFAFESVRMLKGAGIDVICGSDAAGPALGTAWGVSMHLELSLFVRRCGFSPREALRSATALTADRFGFADRGRIERGRRADLLLVEGDPTADVDDLLNLRAVWRDGVLCETYRGDFR